jgi:AraC-like DNA-binding protein
MSAAGALALASEEATVSVAVSKPFDKVLAEAGHDPAELKATSLPPLLHKYHLPLETLQLEGARVPHSLSVEMLERTTALLGTDTVALRAARLWRLGEHGVGDYLNATCESVGALVSTITEHVGLLHDGLAFRTEQVDDESWLFCELDPDAVPHRMMSESALCKVMAELRHAFGGSAAHLVSAVYLERPEPRLASDRLEYQDLLGPNVSYGQSRSALVFRPDTLGTALPTADPVLHSIVRRQASELLRARPKRVSFIDQVRAIATDELPKSSAHQEAVARRLGMSAATLRRRLEHQHDVRYLDLVNELRREVAASRLAQTRDSIDDIGIEAGFAQKTAFYRAFKRWFGCTPAEYRRAHGLR